MRHSDKITKQLFEKKGVEPEIGTTISVDVSHLIQRNNKMCTSAKTVSGIGKLSVSGTFKQIYFYFIEYYNTHSQSRAAGHNHGPAGRHPTLRKKIGKKNIDSNTYTPYS